MKQIKLLFLLFATVLAGCSSNDDITTPNGDNGDGKGTQTIINSGVQSIPLVAPKGTENVIVKYTSEGTEKTFVVPFVTLYETGNNSLVNGQVTLFSAKPAIISITDDADNVLAENILLSGRQFSTASTSSAVAKGKEMAYYFIARDKGEGAQYKESDYYPTSSYGGPYVGAMNYGYIYSEGVNWETDSNGSRYIYSSDGSAISDLLSEIPDLTGHENSKVANFLNYNTETQEIVWNTIKEVDGKWFVYGLVKSKSANNGDNSDKGENPGGDKGELVDSIIPSPVNPDAPTTEQKKLEGIYHNCGVLMWDNDGDKDYNDLVVDYDMEYRSSNSGVAPYIKIVMHLRAMSKNNINRVDFNFDNLERYVAPNDDFDIWFHGISINDTEEHRLNHKYDNGEALPIPFNSTNCKLIPGWDKEKSSAYVDNLQWLLTNATDGWYKYDEHGCYNLTQDSWNRKPFATLYLELHPTEWTADGDMRTNIINALNVTKQYFTVDGESGDYIIAPNQTPHTAEGYTFKEAFPNYPNAGWYKNAKRYNKECVVDVRL